MELTASRAAWIRCRAHRGLFGLLFGLRQHRIERVFGQTIERAEIRTGQRCILKVPQKRSAFEPPLFFLLTPRLVVGPPPRQFFKGRLFVFDADFASSLPIQIHPVGRFADRNQIRRAAGIPTKKSRQHLFAEHAWCTFLNVHLNAQFQRLCSSCKQGWEKRFEAFSALSG